MKKLLIIGIFWTLLLPIYGQNPADIITKMIEQMDKNAIESNFTLALQEDMIGDPAIYRGKVIMKGHKFHLSMGDTDVYYDGVTQWMYSEETEELSITTPTQDDLAGTNPLLILKQFKRSCNIAFYDKEQYKEGYVIAFYPKEEHSEIRKLLVTVRKDTTLPIKLVLEASRGNVTSLVLSNLKVNVPTTDSTFNVSATQYPNAIINDLR